MGNSAIWRRLAKSIGVFSIALITFLAIGFSLNDRLFVGNRGADSWIRTLAEFPILLEELTYDRREALLYKHKSVDPDIVMLAIDDTSIHKIGRFPWTRTVWGKVLDRLAHFQTKVVAFDVVLSEPERFCAAPSPDQELAKAITNFQKDGRSVVIAFGFTDDPNSAAKEIPMELQASAATGQVLSPIDSPLPFVNYTTLPVPELLATFPKLGHISSLASSDGVFRRVPILLPAVTEKSVDVIPTLALAAYQAWADAGEKKTTASFNLDGAHGVFDLLLTDANEKKASVELGEFGELRLRFRGGMDKFKTISVLDLLQSPENDPKMLDLLRGKTVFIGSTAFAAHDIRHTPVDAALPGVYMHANVFSMLRDRLFTKPARDSLFMSLGFFVVALPTLLLIMLTPWPLLHFVSVFGLIFACFWIDYKFFLGDGYMIALGTITIGLLASYSWITLFEFIASVLERRQIRSTFQRYVAPSIVKQMLAHPELLKVGGTKRNVSMMFSDVRDFTSISEKLSPQDLATLLNRYMGRMTEILFDTQGTLDKYIGDAIVGFWGAPVDVPGHPDCAVRGGLAMVEALPIVNAEFQKLGFPQISIGIGINSGEVSVGNMGSDRIFQYTALGDHMNLASRLEGLTKNYGVQLLVSEFTIESLTEKTFVYRPIDRVRVKGKAKAVGIFEILHHSHPLLQQAGGHTRFTQAFELYQTKQFESALRAFEALEADFPEDKPTQIHIQNCRSFIASPPQENWDGATTFKTK